ncbi:hypothetical protein CEUSTIGMA_g1000.t1 [Chlamydomonas eustigma]|uniref:Phospholipid/glycerol acyltransferase domain-containing protein n=1 Tax=Chlamydomonas eustigma TaxID=1157962 RepID=A0A250WS84_9CHLO|nr:hypothetical protein CEUSTIGMA_g1000.t1 [Chlamydomonas eustigma]|eukprot:GAX73549.1 hypothetical protein CEUSTIGMA_g1000.t1 [Chlamydomonas eustigma]
MTVLVLPIRFVLASLCVVACNITIRIASVLPDGARQDTSAAVGKLWCNLCLLSLGFFVRWVKVTSEQLDNDYPASDMSVKAVGIISNHCSWADILIHLSRSFPSFAARDGTQNLPLIGYISKVVQCVFVERNKEAGAKGVSAAILDRMIAKGSDPDCKDRPILLFPELPVYNPSEAERKDPALYASNLRTLMVKFGKFEPSNATYEDKMEYHQLIRNGKRKASKQLVEAASAQHVTKQDELSPASSTS